MGAGTGKHTISMKLTRGSALLMAMFCGVLVNGAPCDDLLMRKSITEAWLMYSGDGGLHGNGKHHGDVAGGMYSGQVLTMQLDTDSGTLKFWVDGKLLGPGYTSGVTGPLRCATAVLETGSAVEIVPTPELQ